MPKEQAIADRSQLDFALVGATSKHICNIFFQSYSPNWVAEVIFGNFGLIIQSNMINFGTGLGLIMFLALPIYNFYEVVQLAQKRLVEHNALLQAVEMGMSKDAIMEKFNIKSLPELKVAYFDAMVALDKIKNVKKGPKPKKVDNKVGINSRGSLVIPKQLVDALELGEMDTFEVVKNDSGLMLKTVKKATKDDFAEKERSCFDEKEFAFVNSAKLI